MGDISTKEVQLANYLDMVAGVKVTTHLKIDEHYSYEQIIDKGNIDVKKSVNE